MKVVIVAVMLLLACPSTYARDSDVRDATLAKLKSTHTYKAVPPTTPETETSNFRTDPDIIHMAPVVVTSSRELIDLARDFDHKAALKAAKSFTFERGGLIKTRNFGKVEVEVGVWASLVTPRNPGALPVLRVDFLNLRW